MLLLFHLSLSQLNETLLIFIAEIHFCMDYYVCDTVYKIFSFSSLYPSNPSLREDIQKSLCWSGVVGWLAIDCLVGHWLDGWSLVAMLAIGWSLVAGL